ncbi:unnamed protein product [Calypogeia fissa]
MAATSMDDSECGDGAYMGVRLGRNQMKKGLLKYQLKRSLPRSDGRRETDVDLLLSMSSSPIGDKPCCSYSTAAVDGGDRGGGAGSSRFNNELLVIARAVGGLLGSGE